MDGQRAARVATFGVGIAVASYAAYQLGKLVQRKRHDAKNNTSCVELRPPFPDEVVQLLRSSVLCYLSTLADGAPHLSLMNFTYCPADEKIIMSTRRDTTKYRALLKNKRVAVLIHDFPAEERQRAAAASAKAAGHSGDYARACSVALYGSVQVETGAAAERYRAMHLERNGAGQRQFIVGDNIGIITVLVDKARICNQADKVRIWDASAPVVQSPSECDVDSPKARVVPRTRRRAAAFLRKTWPGAPDLSGEIRMRPRERAPPAQSCALRVAGKRREELEQPRQNSGRRQGRKLQITSFLWDDLGGVLRGLSMQDMIALQSRT